MTTLAEQAHLEIVRMTEEATAANAVCVQALRTYQELTAAQRQAEKDYTAAKKMADQANLALIKALGGDG